MVSSICLARFEMALLSGFFSYILAYSDILAYFILPEVWLVLFSKLTLQNM